MHASIQARRFCVQRTAKGTMVAEVVAECDATNAPRLHGGVVMGLETALAYDPQS